MSPFPTLPGTLCVVLLALSVVAPVLATDADAIDASAAALRAAVDAERARAPAPRFERGDFVVESMVRGATLSPDGRQVAYLRERGSHRSVWLLSATGDAPRQWLGQTDAERLLWSRDGRWLLLASSQQLFALAVAGQAGSGIVTTLGGRDRRELQAVDPVRPATVIVTERTRATLRTAERWRLLRVDMRGKRTLLHEGRHRISGFAFDPRGRLAFLQRIEGEALVIHRVDAQGRLQQLVRCGQMQRCTLLPRTGDGGELLLRSDLDGNLNRLLRVAADGTRHTLHVDPRGEADLDEVVVDPASGRPLIASYRSTVTANYGLTAETRRHVDAIAKRFPQRNLSIEVGRGKDASWLLGERAAALQGVRWHLYDPRSGRFRDVLDELPVSDRGAKPARWLPEAAMAHKLPFAWRASDGMRLHGFLWLPPGADPASLPLVTLVHGGPWNAVTPEAFGAGYSQFLANRGYAVFEPNFRGSTGHGRDYVFAARGDFGNGRVQQDIVEGTRYLLAQGIGDARRVGIAGGSFGGYSTLLGVTFQPELFKVGVAIVPPPDFAWDLIWVGRSSEALNLSDRIPYAAWLRMLSLDLDDDATMARLHAQSPLANADKLQRPLLMFAGGKDRRVPIRGVTGYAARLKLLGKDISLLVDPDAGHVNDDPLAREATFYLLELMLQRHLGGAEPIPPDKPLRDYLQRTLRVTGSDLRDAGLHGGS